MGLLIILLSLRIVPRLLAIVGFIVVVDFRLLILMVRDFLELITVEGFIALLGLRWPGLLGVVVHLLAVESFADLALSHLGIVFLVLREVFEFVHVHCDLILLHRLARIRLIRRICTQIHVDVLVFKCYQQIFDENFILIGTLVDLVLQQILFHLIYLVDQFFQILKVHFRVPVQDIISFVECEDDEIPTIIQ